MARFLVQVRFQRTTLRPEDVVINTFGFTTTALQTNLDAIAQAVIDFYELVPPGAGLSAVRTFMSPVIDPPSPDVHEVRLYNLSDPEPRPIAHRKAFGLSTVGVSPLPSEVALVLSMYGTPTAGISPARNRGRLYVGPLATSAVAAGVGDGDARPAPLAMAALRSSACRLASSSAGTWSIYSRTDDFMRPVRRVATDDAFDTQRRRGAKAVNRILDECPLPT